jgi:mannose-6-phosphate isomerase-like protein (cupin superfamily)
LNTFDFGPEVAHHIDRYGSDFRMSRLVHSDNLHVGCMRLGPGGLVGYHRAVAAQLFAIVEGEGWVRGEGSDHIPIKAGQAVMWESGEQHEAGTDTGMIAIVVEGALLSGGTVDIGPPGRQTGDARD